MKRLLFAAALTLTCAAAAHAQATLLPTTYVSADGGSDSNPCSRTAPCREIDRALQVVKPGGYVYVVAGGDYESFDVAKSVTVAALPGVAAIVGRDGDMMNVRVHDVGERGEVTLRGLTVVVGAGPYGIPSQYGILTSGTIGTLLVEDCVVTGQLIGMQLLATGSHIIRNTVVRGAAIDAFGDGGALVRALVENCRVENSGQAGVLARGRAEVTVRNTVSSFNKFGFEVSGAEASLVVDGCLASHNSDFGVNVNNGGTARVGASTVARSGQHAFRNSGGTFYTFGNNQLAGNAAVSYGTITPAALR